HYLRPKLLLDKRWLMAFRSAAKVFDFWVVEGNYGIAAGSHGSGFVPWAFAARGRPDGCIKLWRVTRPASAHHGPIFFVAVNLRRRVRETDASEYPLMMEALKASRRRHGFLLGSCVLMPEKYRG
ncbi:MAG: hypothetical protein ACRD1N_05230, partial [Terriglobia bacterium]